MKNKNYTFILILISMLLFSCDNTGKIYDEVKEVNGNFSDTDSLVYIIDIHDVKEKYNITTTIRNDINYDYYNLYLKISIKDLKNRNLVQEKGLREVFIFDPKTGDPQGYTTNIVGKKMGGLFDHEYLLYKNISFTEKGKYKIVLKHYMREVKLLKGIQEIGIRMYPISKN